MTMLQEAIEDLKVRALGKKIGDEAVLLRNEIKQALSALDDISVESGEDYLLLKWGTLKGWELHSSRGQRLLQKYHSLGSSMSAMCQKDTDEQKQLICEMIDECDGIILNDWSGDYMTKAEAKDYVLNYNN